MLKEKKEILVNPVNTLQSCYFLYQCLLSNNKFIYALQCLNFFNNTISIVINLLKNIPPLNNPTYNNNAVDMP